MSEGLKSVILGRNAVKEALKSGRLIDSLLISNSSRQVKDLVSLAKAFGVAVKFVSCEKTRSYGLNSQGVVAVASRIKYFSVDEILNFAKEAGEPPFFLICDGIEDPRNLGALFRTAEAVKVSGVIVSKRRCAPINETVEKASVGALNFLKIARVSNLVDAIKKLQKLGLFIYAADALGKNYSSVNFSGAVGLVVGSEGRGVRSLVKKTCDGVCRIPMMGKVNSLNVSVAGGVLMYEILKQRSEKNCTNL